jgi:hypothetical protein
MKKAVILLIMFFTVICNINSETFYVYVEEIYNDEEMNISPPAKDSLLDNMFELGHIVFDDVQGEGDVNWQNEAFERIIGKALFGGAGFCFLVKISSHGELINNEDFMSIETEADYYCIELKTARIISQGSINMDNFYKEEEINKEDLGYLLGNELSYILDNVYKEYIVQL